MTRWLATSWAVFLLAVVVYSANGRAIGSGDSLPARYLPFSILRAGSFTLNEFPLLYGEQARAIFPLLDGVPYYLRYRHGDYLSAYSPGPAVLALPVYAVPVLGGMPPSSPWVAHLEKLSAVLMTALSVVLLFQAMRRLVSGGWALAIAMIYAFGTSSLSASSQGLWQHGPGQLCLALAIYWVARGLREERYLGYVGFALAGAMAVRATNALIVLPLAAWILYRYPRARLRFILFAVPPLGALALYTAVYFGRDGVGWGNATVSVLAFFTQVPLLEGLAGLLLSPSRGLFVYSPVLLFSLLGIIVIWMRGPALLRALSLGPMLLLLVISKWFMWWGGHTFGPRILVDTTPILAFFLVPLTGYLDRHRLAKGLFALCAAVSIAAHALGAFFYDGRWDGLARVDQDYSRLWTWTDSPLAFYAREALGTLRPGVGAASGLPTSADSPALLGAAYTVEPTRSELYAGESLAVTMSARNTGRAIWLASAAGERGAVRLGWRWYSGDREVLAGRAALAGDVLPGGSFRFTPQIAAPERPGDYTLLLDLVSEGVTWFSTQGARPVSVTVRVLEADPTRLVTGRMEPPSAAPTVSISTDRPSYRSGILRLSIQLENPHRPRSFDAYLVLQGPEHRLWFYDGHRLHEAVPTSWVPWAKKLPLPARINGRFELPVSSLENGRYGWHLVLTEAGSPRAIARAHADFSVER